MAQPHQSTFCGFHEWFQHFCFPQGVGDGNWGGGGHFDEQWRLLCNPVNQVHHFLSQSDWLAVQRGQNGKAGADTPLSRFSIFKTHKCKDKKKSSFSENKPSSFNHHFRVSSSSVILDASFYRLFSQERVGNFLADFYSVNGLVLESRKRREHLSEEDILRNKAIMESLSKGGGISEQNFEVLLLFPCDRPCCCSWRWILFCFYRQPVRRKSLTAPTPNTISWEEYITAEHGKWGACVFL